MAANTRKPRHGALDAALGERIRYRRRQLQLSQSALGAKLGITFQQVQKYENGTNRISAAMLLKLSEALELTVNEILQEADAPAAAPASAAESARLVAAFERIQSSDVRAAVLTLVSGLSVH